MTPEEFLAVDDQRLRLEVTIPEEQVYTFKSQARQFPKVGPPGLTYEQQLSDAITRSGKPAPVDCIFYRNRKGHLVGILYHYPVDTYEPRGPRFAIQLERAHNINLFVREDRRRRGIGTKLAREAERLGFKLRPEHQRYTAAGAELMRALVEGKPDG